MRPTPTPKKEKILIEFPFGNCSVQSLWNYISTPNGLAEWFADEVSFERNRWNFKWGKEAEQEATLLFGRSDLAMKFRWAEDTRDYFFEMKIVIHEMSKQVSLEITDYVEMEEIEDQKLLWSTQVDDLMRCMGV